MPIVVRSRDAEEDLDRIVDRIASHNLSAALRWFDEMRALFHLLAAQPEIGEAQKTRRFGEIRRHCRGNYVTYYRPIPDGIEIVRVLHAAWEPDELV